MISEFRLKLSPNALVALLIGGIFFLAFLPVWALADNVRPAYLELEELASGHIRVVWKVPLGQGLPPRFEPSLPEGYRMIPPQKTLETYDSIVETWEMMGPALGLAGARIGIDGLKETTMDALVRIRMSDGSVHRVVLRPTQSATTIPYTDRSGDDRLNFRGAVLEFLDTWRYVLLFSMALALSLVPLARRRNIVLCALALAAGALCGQALGGLTPGSGADTRQVASEAEAAKIVQRLMLNTYRAFMLAKDEEIYDTLARSVAGDFLGEVYLRNRESMRMRDSDGAMALIDQLDIKSIESMDRKRDGGIDIVATWDVYGSVYHQKHVHYRCNTYKARVIIEPTADYWKLVKLELLDEQRVM